jgi:hypothetical protein
MKIIGSIVATVVALVLGAIMGGFVFSKLWVWFMVPIFDLNPLRIVEAIGLTFIVGYMTKDPIESSKELEGPFLEELLKAFLQTLVMAGGFLFIGWIIHLFM